MLKRFFNRMTNKLFFLSFVLIFFSCESDPVSVDSSFSNNNSFLIQTFEVNAEQSYTFQDDSLFNGRSYRLYSGNIDDINSKIFMKINTSYLADSKYCQVDTASYSDSTIHSVDSLQIVFRSFDELMDEDSLLLLDTTMLDIVGGFGIIPNWNEDSLHIFSSLEEPMDLTSIIDSSMQIENYTFSLNLPFNDDWCTSEQDYYIVISYNPEHSHEFQCLELTSSQYSSGISDSYRPSMIFSYNQFNEIIDYINRFSIDGGNLFIPELTLEDEELVYVVNNDTLSTFSKVFIVGHTGFDPEGTFSENINTDEIYLKDISLGSFIFNADHTYELELNLDLEDSILDSIETIDFILDSIIVIGDNEDPSQDNSPLGGEGDSLFTIIGDSTESFIDLGFDWCPDLYETGSDSCLCNFVDNPEECNDIEDEDLIYNESGTEGNGIHDTGEEFPEIADTGVDGCADEYEGGLNEQGNTTCLDDVNPDYQEGSDPNEDNYLLDPTGDDWNDCGEDGLCDEDEEGYDIELNQDPSNDNWGSDNLNGTEGNSNWEEGEGTEGNGQYDYGEPYYDWGTDGIPQEDEINCLDCTDDIDTEGNNAYDLGEPYQDTGIEDSTYTPDEEGYNPNGTEGNGIFNFGEDLPTEYDCGEDGICNDGDPSDDYNIDPNNDNWLDCGSDSDCEVEDDDDTQGNGEWDPGELHQGNSQFDSTDSVNEFYYDWGIDQLPDSLEVLSTTNLLTYSAPPTISYIIDGDMTNINNALDESKDILFDIVDIVQVDDPNYDVKVRINLIANVDFKAIQFRLNHSPYINETSELIHSTDIIRKIDQNELIEDLSSYDNLFSSYDFSSDSTLVLDYLNGVRFSLNFSDLSNFIQGNPGIYINDSYTTLGLNLIHAHPNYNFFDNQVNLWAKIGDENRFLTTINPSSNSEILIPFAHVIQDIINDDIDLSEDIIFLLDGVYDNRSRLVLHKTDELLSPKLEVFYSE